MSCFYTLLTHAFNFEKKSKKASTGSEKQSPPHPADGAYTCCHCRHPNPLYMHPGPHPLGAVLCRNRKCAHIWCRSCSIPSPSNTNGMFRILTPTSLHALDSEYLPEIWRAYNVPAGRICEHCGLTWRAGLDKAGRLSFAKGSGRAKRKVRRWGKGNGRGKCDCGEWLPGRREECRVFVCPWVDLN